MADSALARLRLTAARRALKGRSDPVSVASTRWLEATAAVCDGDAVAVRGALRREPDPDAETERAGYRLGAMRAWLVPAPSQHGLTVLARGRPRVRARPGAVLRHRAVLVAAALALASGIVLARQHGKVAAHCREVCAATGECHVGLGAKRGPADALSRLGKGEIFTCRASSDADCHRSTGCRGFGRCSAEGGECVAAKVEDCARSLTCLGDGRCAARDGRCSYGRDEDCAGQPACAAFGECAAGGSGCEPKTSEHCRGSALCARYGWCDVVREFGKARCFVADEPE